MAAKTVARLPIVSSRPVLNLSSISQRPFTTLPSVTPVLKTQSSRSPAFSRPALQQSFRRSYADTVAGVTATTGSPPPSPPKPKRPFRFFRWVWRLTYLSAIGAVASVGWLTWNIYDLRHPAEQFEPDPAKKTLVILGMQCLAMRYRRLYD